MIKATSSTFKETNYKTEQIDGPPLDFGFKNIRVLQDLISLNTSKHKISKEESVKPTDSVGQQSSQKQLSENTGEMKLNIIRTIDVEGGKDDVLKNFVSKKAEKTVTKLVKKVETKTTSLFLRYNKIINLNGFTQILQQILPGKWDQLIWIDLSHNRLTNISKQFQALPQLRNLYLHVNFISSFKQFQNLQGAKLLRTFTIHGNPIQNYPQFRSLLTALLPQLQKIDSALLTKRQKERGEVIKKQGSKYPVIQNPQKPPEDSEQEQDG